MHPTSHSLSASFVGLRAGSAVLFLEGLNTRTKKRVYKYQEKLHNTFAFSKASENKLKKRGKGTERAGST